jgi:predicted proteasome-type protease
MKWTSWAFLAFLGSLAFFVLFIADQQMNAGIDRLSTMKLPSQSALDGDPDLKLVSERSPNMRTER